MQSLQYESWPISVSLFPTFVKMSCNTAFCLIISEIVIFAGSLFYQTTSLRHFSHSVQTSEAGWLWLCGVYKYASWAAWVTFYCSLTVEMNGRYETLGPNNFEYGMNINSLNTETDLNCLYKCISCFTANKIYFHYKDESINMLK
jgi:hypothetical protein